MTARAFIIAAPRSGSGKTTVTLGVAAALHARGVRVRAVKSGPDYIDPAFHAAATGEPGLNLDSFAMPPVLIDALAAQAGAQADIVLIEASMGLFDGIEGEAGRSGAAADLAARLGLPVVLVLDISGQSQSAAAVVRGFATHDPRVRIAGVILNQVASERHRAQASAAIAGLGIQILGSLPRDGAVRLPERHLGLVQAGEHPALAAQLAALAERAEKHIDLDALLALGAPLPASGPAPVALVPPGQRIALAQDVAFSFAYEHVVAGWRRAGAEILPFSPLANEAPDADADICWLPGGYPELHGETLAHASRFLDGLREFAQTRPVHGECGGFMVLGQSIEDAEGRVHPMLGLLGHATSFAKRRLNLGYRQAVTLHASPLGPAGTRLRGHEFHYASVTQAGDDAPLVELSDGQGKGMGPSGRRRGLVSGTFFHVIATDGHASGAEP
ncbi:hydrogenobyrinic acid a,c-diamide synthase (glutamine-hydrolysing) /cobyrinate a,c-diamide synthase [Ancylobacter aquaticus]|uniref:Hydrogenobyrinate a,c-diamide synthase n=1 Tax=Ancylobacter aquaticus TaxID=100 RepID=A0A4R1I5N7_ANCAQ|nr:cobyrinate a,c-diamide synthase [Ancylobacter aquaticus]TCK29055.1 hydrogenobyrinic acid a,c-diamide synthase (glutamine-hydrolysing) /cobyrinate a,c-diamide synthase [Ancylobacter aquaticus]